MDKKVRITWASNFVRWVVLVGVYLGAILFFGGMLGIGGRLYAAEVEVLVGPKEPDPGKDVQPGELNAPFAVCFDPDQWMWIVEYDGGRLMRWSKEEGLVHEAGDGTAGYANGTAKLSQFNQLHNITRLPDGRFVMSDHLNHALRVYDPNNKLVSTLGGNGQAGFAGDGNVVTAARFNQPICVEMSGDGKVLLVADIRNRRLRQISIDDWRITTIAGNGRAGQPQEGQKATEASLVDPRAAVSDAEGTVYFLERGGNALRRIGTDGSLTTLAGSGKAGFEDGIGLRSMLNGPKHLCMDAQRAVYIADDNNHAVRRFDLQSGALTTVDLGEYRLKRPHGVTVHEGWLYIADSYHHRVLRVRIE